MERSFEHKVVFPLVARLIRQIPGDADGFCRHDAIVTTVLGDPEGRKLVSQARRKKPAYPNDHYVASKFVAWFSARYRERSSPFKDDFERKKLGDKWAYRPKPSVRAPIMPDPYDVSAIEGDPRMRNHLELERDSAIVRAKRDAARRPDGQLACEVCEFVVPNVYPGLHGDICEVHHRLPLGRAAGRVTTRLKDLAILCPNCHRAIHRTDLSVEDFRSRFLAKVKVKPSCYIRRPSKRTSR